MSGQRGFTLVELLVAAAILAVMATFLIPSFFTVDRRRDKLAVDEVEDLLTMYAYRDSTGTQPVALAEDPETGAIGLWVKDVDPLAPERPAVWMPDRFSDPVILPVNLQLTQLLLDGRDELVQGWTITRAPSEPRPLVEIVISSRDTEVSLILGPTSLSPYRLENGVVTGLVRQAIDLDRRGLDREEW